MRQAFDHAYQVLTTGVFGPDESMLAQILRLDSLLLERPGRALPPLPPALEPQQPPPQRSRSGSPPKRSRAEKRAAKRRALQDADSEPRRKRPRERDRDGWSKQLRHGELWEDLGRGDGFRSAPASRFGRRQDYDRDFPGGYRAADHLHDDPEPPARGHVAQGLRGVAQDRDDGDRRQASSGHYRRRK